MSGTSPSKLVPTELVVNTDTLDVVMRRKNETASGLAMLMEQEVKNQIARNALGAMNSSSGSAYGSGHAQGSVLGAPAPLGGSNLSGLGPINHGTSLTTVASGASWPGLQSTSGNPFMDAWNAANVASSPPEPARARANATIRITQAANGQILDVAMGTRTVTWLVPDGEPLAANIDAALAVLKLEGGG